MTTAVIVTAAGSGTRLGHARPKAFVPLAGESILARALAGAAPVADHLIVTAPADHLDAARAIAARFGAVVVAGGDTRQASVAAGLGALPADADVVLVHDAARALTPPETFASVLAAVRSGHRAVVPGRAVVDTVKEVEAGEPGRVVRTPDRATLRAVQTPQGFDRALLERAHAAAASGAASDDAGLVEALGEDVWVVPGSERALKITTAADLEVAARWLATPGAGSLPRVGIGTDVHAFADPASGRTMWLGCVEWPGESGLAAHSDGDVAAHAVIDAVLGAAGLGDIGSTFGTARPEWAGAEGAVLLSEAARLVRASGWEIGNATVQVVGVRPRLGARRAEVEAAMSAALGAPVAVSATTTDGLGFTGRAEGLTAVATALVHPRP